MAIQTLNDLATLLEQRTKINANFAELELTKYAKPVPGIPLTDLAAAVQTSLTLANTALQATPVATASVLGGIKVGSGLTVTVDGTLSASGTSSPNATTTTPGIVQLAGDLGGTATAPTVPGLATRAPRANGGGALGATRTTTDADDALNFTAPVACTITVHPGAVQGFGFGVSGPGVVTWAGGAGVTVTDKRNTGASIETRSAEESE